MVSRLFYLFKEERRKLNQSIPLPDNSEVQNRTESWMSLLAQYGHMKAKRNLVFDEYGTLR